MPDNTSDLVALTQFLENASSVTVVNLQTAVDEAGERLLFLLDYATLPCMLARNHILSPPILTMILIDLLKKTINGQDFYFTFQ